MVIRVTDLREVPGPGRADYRVVLRDDQVPGCQGVFVLRSGEPWGTQGHADALEVHSFGVEEVAHPDRRINAVLLREVPFGRWLAAAIGAASDLRDGRDTEIWTVEDPRPMARVGSRVRGAPDYEAVARLYRISVREGHGAVADTVAEAFGVGRDQAAHWVSKARANGLLGPGAPRDLTEAQIRRRQQAVDRLARLRQKENGE